MKTLSLTQPWATLIALGAKTIETRSWRTTYRGPLAIHAAKGFPTAAREVCFTNASIRRVLIAHDLVPSTLPRGVILAVGYLVGCEPTDPACWPSEPGSYRFGRTRIHWPILQPEKSFGDFTPGRFMWILEGVRRLSTPILARGSLGLWTFDDAVIDAALKGHP